MLSIALFCTAINDVLIDFWQGRYHTDLWPRVKAASKFLSYFPERKQKSNDQRLRDIPKYGFRGEEHQMTYEQLVVTQRHFQSTKNKLLEVKRKLPLILSLKTDVEKRREAALCALRLFNNLIGMYHHYFNFPPHLGVPKGITELCKRSKPQK